jgi:hypothetical protein
MSDNLLKPEPVQGTGQLHVPGFTPSATPEPPHRHHVRPFPLIIIIITTPACIMMVLFFLK